MNFSIISKFFKKEKNALHVPDSILVKKLKSLCSHSNLLVYTNINIYHHRDIYNIPLIMLDPLRGLYIFEIKAWSYDDLKNAHIEKAKNQTASKETLSFDNTHDIIRKKFNEILHNDGVVIHNYLIMENLSADEYEHLNDSFKQLLPFDKLIFNDYQDSDIFKKLQNAAQEDYTLPPPSEILGTLFIQYAILATEDASRPKIHLASQEQIKFIDSELEPLDTLSGPSSSGKSSLILIKALVFLLENPSKKVLILKPTTLACDIFKKRLLDIVEHAIVEVDLTSIEIITPIELINRHLEKTSNNKIQNLAEFPEQLLNKKFKVAELIICDDSDILAPIFIAYLKQIQKKFFLLLVKEKTSDEPYSLTHEFRVEKREILFYQTNPYAKVLRLVHKLLTTRQDESIIVISNSSTQEKLKDDLSSFSLQAPRELDASQHLINQSFSQLLLTTYADINTLSAKHIIMLDLCFTNPFEIEYAMNIATKSIHLLYEEESEDIIDLKDKYESTQERTRMESTTQS